MATGEKILSVNSFTHLDVSTQTPQTPGGLSTFGQIGPGSFEGGTPGLAQQEISQAEQNLSQGIIVQPSVSNLPNVTPFPLGCPSGFYQSGDVCIPNVDTAGMNFPNAPAAGHDLPKGSIQQTVVDPTTTQGQPFEVKVYFTNTGILGKFFIHVKIPDIGVDTTSTGVWIPEGSNGVLYKQIVMPTNAPTTSTQGFSMAIQLEHEEQSSGNMIVDDNDSATVPTPGTAPATPVPPTPPFQQNCFTASDGSRWCSSPTDIGGGVCQADPTTPGLFWCKQCSCPTNQKWNNCLCACVPSGSLIADCPPSRCPQCPQPAPPVPPSPPPTQNCFQFQGQTFCQTNAPPGTPGCINVGGITYCAVGAQPPPPTCPTGYSYDSVNKVCVQNPQPTPTPTPPPTNTMPTCFTITLPDLFDYAGKYSRFVEIKTPNVLILSVTQRGLPEQTAHITFCKTSSATDDTVTINGVIYGPIWPHGSLARGSANRARMRAYPGRKLGQQKREMTMPSCFTVTLPSLFEYANKNTGSVNIRNPHLLTARVQEHGLALNNTSVSFCKANAMSSADDCVEINGVPYCPQLTHSENNTSPAIMVLTPHDKITQGGTVVVNLSSFAPNEQVTVTVNLTANPIGIQDTKNAAWRNRQQKNNFTGTTDGVGGLRINIPVPGLPSGVKGHVLISAVGSRSMKQVARDLVVG